MSKGITWIDTETVGFCGPAIILQHAIDDGPVQIHEFWSNPVIESLTLLEDIMNRPTGIGGFNLVFDHFQLCKIYTMFLLLMEKFGPDVYPEDHIDDLAVIEADARDGPCLKPVTVIDLMLHARKTVYQSMMNRKDIRIRRVPTALAHQLAEELERRIPIPDIYFARRSDKKADKWKVHDITDEDGDIITDFKDIVLSFAPSSALKALAVDALKLNPLEVLRFMDVNVDAQFQPEELPYAPFATAIGKPGNWKGTWPDVIKVHINHWANNQLARKYGVKDVEYLPKLYEFFGNPELGDDDSVLSCMVGAVRWQGFRIDVEGIKELRTKAIMQAAKTPTAPNYARRYIEQVLDPTERQVLSGSTKKIILEELANGAMWNNIPCEACNADGEVGFGDFTIIPGSVALATDTDPEWEESVNQGIEFDSEGLKTVNIEPISTAIIPKMGTCEVCDGTKFFRHPASIRAQEVLDARKATKEVELYDKLLIAGRFHASFKVIGTLSSRMSGTDKLNAQGIKSTKEVRSKFPLAPFGYILAGGDFITFEVVIADAVYNDPDLRAELLTENICVGCKGTTLDKGKPCGDCSPPGSGRSRQSIHGLFGTFVYPGMSYVDILNTKKTADDKYTRSKSAVFAMLYGGEAYTLMTRLGVTIEVADEAYRRFTSRFKKVGEERRKVFNMFCSMVQSGGRGTRVEWHEPSDYIESVFGFRRYFTLENRICKTLFQLGENPPKSWKDIKIKVIRRDREQTATGAVQSALFGAAFQIQAGNMRAAANHVIQSAGAQITKNLQRRIWDMQPSGISKFVVMPMNVHDELMVPTLPEYIPQLNAVVKTTIDSFRSKVPLIGIDWSDNLSSWAAK